ncbi:siderophore-interacting protein [Solirubrobacter sp. CPCC 204708]|uniref:Siderophore-interacting protein n=1 Tax=Solirubrobacter deserti TaxID=2282478 RepID=A0ABT4RSM0_9ACTN|nr:siderophore-interacting protein [Solirubrobacter deserti]MBE2315896.1 siderophore-interacting protein [Solirubrobacter deserti]MDA0141577.1 siderophore-interacting protein [Solirubrobacter deserti]
MPPRVPRRVSVVSTEHVTPHMVRVVLGGPAFDGFAPGEFTDHYVKLLLPDPQAPERTRTRTYTVREWDAKHQQLTIDFVVHGDVGVAGPWARRARPGDELDLLGPGGAYTPDPAADWHLLAGDASVIPAISASLPRIAPGTPVHVVIEVDGPQEEQPLDTPGDLRLAYVHRSAPPGEEPELLAQTVAALDLPDGRGHVFVHGEASSVRNLRRHLVADRGLDPAAMSISGYWKLKRTEEGWREDKAEWARLVEADVAAS